MADIWLATDPTGKAYALRRMHDRLRFNFLARRRFIRGCEILSRLADHEGIIHEIAHTLSQFGINIESMDTVTTRAPVSGAPLFSMSALVLVPPELPGKKWRSALEDVGNQVNVDIQVSAGPR